MSGKCGHGLTTKECFVCASPKYSAHHVAAPSVAPEPLFLLHSGQIDSGGEQDDWETEADSQVRVDEFCRLHPGKTIPLFAHPPREASVAPEPLHVDETKRYRVVQKGYWWRVQIGDGQQTVGRCFSQTEAQHLAHALVVAYRDGFFVASLSAHPPRAPLTEEHVTAVVRSVCPNLAETSKAWRDLVVECRYWLEAAHGIGGK